MWNKTEKSIRTIFVAAVEFYQKTTSPWLGSNCRFSPSCSHYAQDAVLKKGMGPGLWLSIKRLLKCQPFHPGGWDPVE